MNSDRDIVFKRLGCTREDTGRQVAGHCAAQATADMIIQAARTVPGARLGDVPVTHIPVAGTASGYCQM